MNTSQVKEKGSVQRVKWTVDKEHSEITFRVKHMMITNVTGILKDFEIEAESSGDHFEGLQVNFSGRTKSITTGNEKRDAHLQSPDFFDVENHEEITFISVDSRPTGANNYDLLGDLKIGEVTKPLVLEVQYHGINRDPWGNDKAGFSVQGTISRKDYGLTWNVPLEGGGLLVSDEVKISCEIQMIKSR